MCPNISVYKVGLYQQFSTTLPRGLLMMSEDIFGGSGDATGIYWVDTRDAAKNPTMYQTAQKQRLMQPEKSIALRSRKSGQWRTGNCWAEDSVPSSAAL